MLSHIFEIYAYIVVFAFTLVSVMENSSTSETDKEEKEKNTQSPDLTSGKCHLPHLEWALLVLTSLKVCFIYSFLIYLKEKRGDQGREGMGRERESSIHGFTAQMATIARVGPGPSQKPGPSGPSVWVAEAHILELS